jgi:hypothetical protein
MDMLSSSFRSSVGSMKNSSFGRRVSLFFRSFDNQDKAEFGAHGRKRRNTGGYHPKVDKRKEAVAEVGGYGDDTAESQRFSRSMRMRRAASLRSFSSSSQF